MMQAEFVSRGGKEPVGLLALVLPGSWGERKEFKEAQELDPPMYYLGGEREVALELGGGPTKVGVKYEEMIRSAGIGGTRVKVRCPPRFLSLGAGGLTLKIYVVCILFLITML